MSEFWITTMKVALLAYLVIGVVMFVVVRRRRQRAAWDDYLRSDVPPPTDQRRPSQPGYEATIRGAMPVTPLPDWIYADEDPERPTASR
jgi:hypothetical protein